MPKSRTAPVYHVTPQNDLYKHVIDRDGTCWCCPDTEIDDEDDMIITHHAYDRREDYKDGLRKPH
ncbi:MAG: hypothetical protein ABFE08_17720 [Armatimonadia bacterium]